MNAPRRAVKRRSNATVFSSGKRCAVIVTLYPDGLIGLRLFRHRREEFIDPAAAYREAVAYRAAIDRAKKRAAKKAGKR